MGSAIRKTTLREIKGTFGRFFAIMAIIALGVGFFTGVRITTPAMVNTVSGYLNEKQFYDYRLLSSLGWNDDDIADFRLRPDVRSAEGAYSLDILTSGDKEYVLRAHSITEDINGIRLRSGRMPEAPDECLVDANKGDFKIGKVFNLSPENSDRVKESLAADKLKVVGTCDSSLYINFERGTTSVGNGEITAFIYLPAEAFDMEVYTEAYVRFQQDFQLYSDEYDSCMEGRDSQWEDIARSRADIRYEELRSEAQKKLDDGRKELDDKRAEGQQKLDSARADLDSAKAQLDGQAAQLEQIKEISPEQYAAGMEQYNAALADYEKGEADYESSLADFNKQTG
ncbi:MAG TPA: ABC transporter permease, partial [Ruminococcus sp.]|nr:ABC transporter permease [Ruminococcus sp.]